MASVKVNKNADGQVISYRFFASTGERDNRGNPILRTKTVKADKSLTTKKQLADELKEMEAAAVEFEKSVVEGALADVDEKMTFETFVNKYWMKLKVNDPSHSGSTMDYYRYNLPRIMNHFGKMRIRKITSLDIDTFINGLYSETWGKNNNPLSPKTIKHYYRILGSIFGYAYQHGVILKNPMDGASKLKTPKKKKIDFLPPDEAIRFIQTLDKSVDEARNKLKSAVDEKNIANGQINNSVATEDDFPVLKSQLEQIIKWRCMMNILITCGLRRGEVCGLQWSDIDFDNQIIHISEEHGNVTSTSAKGLVAAKPKTDTAIDDIPFPAHIVKYLQEWHDVQEAMEHRRNPSTKKTINFLRGDAFVFGSDTDPYQPMIPSNVTRWMRKYCERNNLPDVSPHDLRHTCGSLILMAGGSIKDVQRLLRHSDAEVSLQYYTETDMDSMKSASNSLGNMLFASSN